MARSKSRSNFTSSAERGQELQIVEKGKSASLRAFYDEKATPGDITKSSYQSSYSAVYFLLFVMKRPHMNILVTASWTCQNKITNTKIMNFWWFLTKLLSKVLSWFLMVKIRIKKNFLIKFWIIWPILYGDFKPIRRQCSLIKPIRSSVKPLFWPPLGKTSRKEVLSLEHLIFLAYRPANFQKTPKKNFDRPWPRANYQFLNFSQAAII